MLHQGFRLIPNTAKTNKINVISVYYAFASNNAIGNPAGIVLREKDDLTDEELVGICQASGLPTISYIVPIDDNKFQLRWITPSGEFDLCGHGTMAACGYLFDNEQNLTTISLESRSGTLHVKKKNRAVSMKFPLLESQSAPKKIAHSIEKILDYPVKTLLTAKGDYAAIVQDESFIRSYTPDMDKIRALNCRGLSISAAIKNSNEEFDIITRTFMPSSGIDEDQACVSAHCKLFSYWSESLGKNHIRSFQASRNGGCLSLQRADSNMLWVTGESHMSESVILK